MELLGLLVMGAILVLAIALLVAGGLVQSLIDDED